VEALPLVADIQLFALIFARMTALFVLFPVFGSSNVPVHYRVGLSFFFVLLLFPILKPNFVDPQIENIFGLFFLMFREAGIGAVIGFLTKFLFTAVGVAGELIDMQMGFMMVQMPDPMVEGNMTSATGYFYVVIFLIAFLMLNGHYFLLLAIHKCFAIMPPGAAVVDAAIIVPTVLYFVRNTMEIAIRLSAPIMMVMIVTTFALGIIAKTMPQMNVFIVGMPLKIGVGLLLITVTLPTMLNFFAGMVRRMYQDIWTLLLRMAGS